MLSPGAMETSEYELLPRSIFGSVALQRPGSRVVSITTIATEGSVDA